jgi:NAD(P)-dependent dehydrogenase (short-subunit alcohol dehydrogenase family)
MCCDVSSEQEVEAWIAGIVERAGGLDTVVNNAGIAPGGPFVEMTLAVWDEMLRINVTGAFLVSRAAIPHLIKRPGASIIMIGSTASFIGLANAVGYGMTKASLVGLAKGLAVELADTGVRVNALCPGGTMTPATEHWLGQLDDPQSVLDELEGNHPIGRLGTTDEQAAAAVFMASDAASFMTGSAMLVDGGYTAK